MNKKTKLILFIILATVLIIGSIFLVVQAIRANFQEIKNPVVTLEIENYGNVKIELYPEYAPNTVKNIIKLVENGYYDGKIFYGKDDLSIYVGRNSEGSVDYPKLSTLDKTVAEEDDYEYEITGEFVANNYEKNTLKHEKGIVSLVRADYTQISSNLLEESYNSGNSQFTILMKDERSLNGLYAAFGKIIEGIEIIEQINSLETVTETEDTTEISPIKAFASFPIITKATVDTYGYNYGFPEVNEAFDYNGYIQELLTQYYSEDAQ